MRTTVCLLALVAAVFILGCQDNSSLNPISDQQLASSTASLSKPKPEIILLKGVMLDPGVPFKSFTEISGQVEVSLTGQSLCDLTLQADAELKPADYLDIDSPWSVSSSTSDRFKLFPGTSVAFEKVYSIAGRSDGTTLHLSFLVTRFLKGNKRVVELTGMWLAASGKPRAVAVATE
ncbi:MAG: hypothetical protein AAB393_15895, partial [Bacteroidota bacterium]